MELERHVKELEETVQKIKRGDPDVLPEVDLADSPLEFLRNIWNNPKLPLRERMRAAITAAQYEHTKKGKAGKKEDAREAAHEAAGGHSRLRPSAPPLKKVA